MFWFLWVALLKMDKIQFWSFLIVHLRGQFWLPTLIWPGTVITYFSDGITFSCYYMKKHWHPDGHLWIHYHVKKRTGVSLLWQGINSWLPVKLVPSHSASPFCDSSFSQSIRPLWSGSFSFHLHFQDFVLIPFLIWTPPTPLLKLCLTGQNRSAFSFKLSLTVPSCSDFKLHWNPILCHFFISLDHYHLLGAECRIIASQWCPHPQNLRGC